MGHVGKRSLFGPRACPVGFDILTDHDKLMFLFDPTTIMADISLGSLCKLLR